MKINVEIDCTPEEARSFLGLPDLKPMQAAVAARLEQQMLDMIGKFDPAMLRAWLPAWGTFGGGASDLMRRMMEGILNASAGGKTDPPRSSAADPDPAPPGRS